MFQDSLELVEPSVRAALKISVATFKNTSHCLGRGIPKIGLAERSMRFKSSVIIHKLVALTVEEFDLARIPAECGKSRISSIAERDDGCGPANDWHALGRVPPNAVINVIRDVAVQFPSSVGGNDRS
jgi:hypothetical protein